VEDYTQQLILSFEIFDAVLYLGIDVCANGDFGALERQVGLGIVAQIHDGGHLHLGQLNLATTEGMVAAWNKVVHNKLKN
jgi:hypothetical protein